MALGSTWGSTKQYLESMFQAIQLDFLGPFGSSIVQNEAYESNQQLYQLLKEGPIG